MPRRASKPNPALKVAGWTAAIVVVIGIGAIIAAQYFLGSFLRSASFRERVEKESGRAIRAQVEIAPHRVETTEFFTERFTAKGAADAAFSRLSADNIRGEYKVPTILQMIFGQSKAVLQNVQIQRIEADITTTDRLALDLPPRSTEDRKVDVKSASVGELKLNWEGGGLAGTKVEATEVEGGWKLEGAGGTLRVPISIPAFDLTSARAVFKEIDRTLIVQDARARIAGGEVSATGDFDPEKIADLQLKVNSVSVTPLLPEDWRARLHGQLFGEARLKIPVKGTDKGMLTISGTASLKNGSLEGLPILQNLAEYTKTDSYRHLAIDEASCSFSYDKRSGILEISNFNMESRQSLRVTGQFSMVRDIVEIDVNVGINPSKLNLPLGVEDKLFTARRDGYAWARIKLSGPYDTISSRLAVAIGNIAVEKVIEVGKESATKAADKALETGAKAAESALDLLFGK